MNNFGNFYTYGVGRSIDVLDPENQPRLMAYRGRWHEKYENKKRLLQFS